MAFLKNLPLQAFPYLQADMAYVGDVFLSVFLGVDCGDLPLLRWPGHIAEGVSRDVGIWMISLNLYLGFFLKISNSGLFAENRFAMFCFKLRRQTLDPYLGLSLILHVGFMIVLVPWRGVSFVLQVKDGKPQAFEVKRLATCLPKLDVFYYFCFSKVFRVAR